MFNSFPGREQCLVIPSRLLNRLLAACVRLADRVIKDGRPRDAFRFDVLRSRWLLVMSARMASYRFVSVD